MPPLSKEGEKECPHFLELRRVIEFLHLTGIEVKCIY